MTKLRTAWLTEQVRMQSEGKLPEGAAKKYPNAMKAYGIIVRCAAPSPTDSVQC